MRPEGFTDEEWNYIDTVVKEAFPEMESHVEIFTLPSGREAMKRKRQPQRR
jgi:hypothetical protein